MRALGRDITNVQLQHLIIEIYYLLCSKLLLFSNKKLCAKFPLYEEKRREEKRKMVRKIPSSPHSEIIIIIMNTSHVISGTMY